jgi:hypothetical protein
MATSVPRRQAILLASLLAVLAAVVAYQVWWAGGSAGPPRAGIARAPRGGQQAELGAVVPDVHLEALDAERPAPTDRGRNLFRDRPEPPEPPAPSPGDAGRRPVAQPIPTGPPPPPPITLKFIGVVHAGGRAVAVLSDGRDVLYGREGEVVDGQYLIVKINVETIEVSYPDGSGRRMIRLTGQ